MGVSIEMKTDNRWKPITPGWRSQMAAWLREVGGERPVLVFTEEDILALEWLKSAQRIGMANPPFDQSDDWVECFDKILHQIREHGEALVRLTY